VAISLVAGLVLYTKLPRKALLVGGLFVGIAGASVVCFVPPVKSWEAAAGAEGGLVFGAMLLAMSITVAQLLTAQHYRLVASNTVEISYAGVTVFVQMLVHIILFVFTIDVMEGASGLGIGLHGKSADVLFGVVLVLWIIIVVIETTLLGDEPTSSTHGHARDDPAQRHMVAVWPSLTVGFIVIVVAIKFSVADTYTFVADRDNQCLTSEGNSPKYIASRQFSPHPDAVVVDTALKTSFRVGTYNVQQMFAMVPRGANNLARVAEALHRERVDVLGMTEASGGNWYLFGNNDPVAFLAARAGYRYTEFAAPTTESSEGVAINSRFELEKSRWEKLPKLNETECEDAYQNCLEKQVVEREKGVELECKKFDGPNLRNSFLVEARVKVDDTHSFYLLVVHTLFSPLEASAKELARVAERAKELEQEGENVVVCGDWNLQPFMDAIGAFRKDTGFKSALPFSTDEADALQIGDGKQMNAQNIKAMADLGFSEVFDHTQIGMYV
jgi:endonuclease/exonuclease/phosphatase family metal-dependent hydrolase